MIAKDTFSKKLNPQVSIFVFLISVLVISFIYDYHNIISFKPQNLHVWRQADCASTALMYSQNGMNFFKPEMHNLHADNMTSAHAVGEFPVYYYIAGGFYLLFGHHEFILRGLTLLTFIIGLFYLYKTVVLVSGDHYWGLIFSLLLFTSPLLAYYANNYLPEVPSLGLSLIGWYYFFHFRKNKKDRSLIFSILFFTLATLIKVTSGMHLIAIVCLLIAERTRLIKSRLKPAKTLISLVVSIVIVSAWYVYAIYYNNLHDTIYYRTGILSYWQVSSETASQIFDDIFNTHKYFIYNDSVYFLVIAMLIFVFVKGKNLFFILLNTLLLTGTFIFLVMWFGLLHEHEYYFAPLLVIIAIVFISFAGTLSANYPRFYKNPIFKLLFAALLVINVIYAESRMSDRFDNIYTAHKRQDLFEIQPYLDSLGIQKNDKVIVTPDVTPNLTLYLINRQGWSDLYYMNASKENIASHIRNGAKYAIFYTDKVYGQHDLIYPFLNEKIGMRGKVQIYSLKSSDQISNK